MILIFDADIVAYKAASTAEIQMTDEDGSILFWGVDLKTAIGLADNYVSKCVELLKGTPVMAFSDPSRNYFRKQVLPEYKANRTGGKPPIGLMEVKRHLEETYETHIFEGLEGDDVMGILGTNPKFKAGETKILVSEDKDLRTIPAWHYNPEKDNGPVKVSDKEADDFFYCQTLSGDATDGYSGCQGIGMETAKKIVAEPHLLIPYEHYFKTGPRKGLSETRYTKEPTDNVWESIVSYYKKAGLTEQDALTQARCARILRIEDYDLMKREVKLWEPSK